MVQEDCPCTVAVGSNYALVETQLPQYRRMTMRVMPILPDEEERRTDSSRDTIWYDYK
jgi:hypothetical protein